MIKNSGFLKFDKAGRPIQAASEFETVGYESAIQQVGTLNGASDGTETNLTVSINSTDFPVTIDPTVSAVAQVERINGSANGEAMSGTISINETDFDLDASAKVDPVAQVDKVDGISDGTETTATLTINTTDFALNVAAAVAAVAQVDKITGAPVTDPVAVTVSINETDLTWNIDTVADMGTEYEELLSLINNCPEPVTASYINAGNHADGIYITADVAGTAFTSDMTGEDGTLALASEVTNVVAVSATQQTAVGYEELLALINAGAEPVTASYVDSGNHSLGLNVTADSAGTAFTSALADETGTMAVATTVANVAEITAAARMIACYEAFLAAVNAGAEPVTASYVNAGNHALGVLLTADVAGTPFTIALANEVGTVVVAQTVANVVEVTSDEVMAAAYEALLALVNAGAEPVTAAYVSGDHEDGITLTADVIGDAFTVGLDGETGTIAYADDVANQEWEEDDIQSPQSVAAELAVFAPLGAVAVVLTGTKDFYVDSKTGVSASQGMLVTAGTYIQLPIVEREAVYLFAAEQASISFAFITLKTE